MRRLGAVLLLSWAAAAALSLSAVAQTYWEVEHARANARAGGPVSADDADLLERYGCLSGTKSTFCERLERKQRAEQRRLFGHRKRPRD